MAKTKETGNQSERSKNYLEEKSPYMKTILFIITLFVTAASTFLMSVSMMSSYWENMTWNKQKIHEITEDLRNRVDIESILNDTIIKFTIHYDEKTNTITRIYLLPMRVGIWTVCVSLTDEQLFVLKQIRIPPRTCFNYLAAKLFQADPESMKDWNYRLQNVSISCALVCLILLISAALVGMFGVLKHQLSAILVTGVMYLLAGVFALFTIMIIHYKKLDFKRNNYAYYHSMRITRDNKTELMDNGIVQETKGMGSNNTDLSSIWKSYYTAREFHAGWSFDASIVGVMCLTITSVLWIILAKLLRYTPPLTQL